MSDSGSDVPKTSDGGSKYTKMLPKAAGLRSGYGKVGGKSLSDEIDALVKKRADEIIDAEKQRRSAVDYHTKHEEGYFSIEPHHDMSSRTFYKMTDEERALRKQWLIDQQLGPNEPRDNPEALAAAYPRNIFRRAWHAPFNAIGDAVDKLVVISVN